MALTLTMNFPFTPAPDDRVLVVAPDGTCVTYEGAALEFGAEKGTPGSLVADVRLEGVDIALSQDASALLAAIGLGKQSRFKVGSLGITWRDGRPSLARGGLVLAVPVNASVGPLSARTFHAIIDFPADRLVLEASLDVDLSIAGGIALSLERVGLVATLDGTSMHDGFPLTLAPHPPTGGGLDLDLGVVKGGGFLSVDEAAGQYAGSFAARLLGIGVNAIGIVNTKPFLSILAMLAADFRPVGIELSFGFTLNAVGGLVGLNRSCDTEQIREGVRTGAIESLMFPADPMRNAPRIIADLGRFFPPRDGQTVVAPMLDLGWGKPAGMIALRLVLIVQAPDPLLQIAGVLSVELPPGLGSKALIRIKAAFVGGVDPGRALVAFDASLIDSHLLFADIEGDFVLRFRYAGRPDFLVCAGGFFPRFAPPADLSLGPMRRLSVSMGNLGPIRLRMESYIAVTSNTAQHGAFMEMGLGVDDYQVSGSLGYDVLIVFDPFAFTAEVGATFRVEAFGETLCTIVIQGRLTGPDPLHLQARGSFNILFVEVSVPIDVSFGGTGPVALPPAVPVRERIRDLLKTPGAVLAERPRSSQADLVVAKDSSDPSLVQPDGELVVKQALVPLGIGIDHIGASRPADGHVFDLGFAPGGDGGLTLGAWPTERFAPGQFFDLSQEQKLSRPAFEDHPAGVRIGSDGLPALAGVTLADFDTEAILIDSEGRSSSFLMRQLDSKTNARLALGGVAAQAKVLSRNPKVILRDKGERFGVIDIDTGARLAQVDGAHDAQMLLASQVSAQPGLRDRLRIVSMLDLETA